MRLDPVFLEATPTEVDAAAVAAAAAAARYGRTPPEARARFLARIAKELLGLGDAWLERAGLETGLPRSRLESERDRTLNQFRMFADLVAEGSWVDARIDHALPERQPIPRPDLRRMLHPLGPVAAFGASNFPLAFSAAGGDTASALAAGCPVVVKGHPAHPGTSELATQAILAAATATGMPEGVLSLVQGASTGVGEGLVTHDAIEAVAFTGSLRAGRALHDLAAGRPRPITVFAEMGSANPVFILPGALAARGTEIAQGLFTSVTLGVGQFCTNPGLAFFVGDELPGLAPLFAASTAGPMTHAGVRARYDAEVAEVLTAGARLLARGEPNPTLDQGGAARPALLATDFPTWRAAPRLGEEIYGPTTLVVRCQSPTDFLAAARSLRGHLTATVHATEADLVEHAELLELLRAKVGRLVLNGFPTGVEVCAAMNHAGPYPACTDPRHTSVGTAAILRFVRAVCYQGFPDAALPEELQESNPRGIWRLVDGRAGRH